MQAFFERWIVRVCAVAERFSGWLQALILAAFFATLLLSFPGWLNQPALYALLLGALTFGFERLARVEARGVALEMDARGPLHRFTVFAIGAFLLWMLVISFFMSPDSADGQRIKLGRMIFSVQDGSAWATFRVDDHSVMYYFPAAYYLIFSGIEALHLPQFSYAFINMLLTVGALLNLLLLVRGRVSLATLLLLVLFIAAPQFIFSGLEEHEDALSFFLVTRAAVWLVARPVGVKSLFWGVWCAGLGVIVKLSSAVFLPFALFILALYFGGKERVLAWVKPAYVLPAAVFGAAAVVVFMLPDIMVDASRGLTIADQFKKLSAYHVSGNAWCAVTHFGLRFFELFFDFPRTLINWVGVNVLFFVPSFDFMPKGCAFDDTSLRSYLIPNPIVRHTTQFGLIPLVAFVALVAAKAKERRMAVLALGLFTLSVAIYSYRMMFWSGTGRYFMVGILILLPAFLVAMEALRGRLKPFYFKALVVMILLPAIFIAIRSLENVPRRILEGQRVTWLAEGIVPALRSIEGKANVYFNDLMPIYALMREIASDDVYYKREIMADAVNVVALPRSYGGVTNWHDNFWLLPVPSAQGQFSFMGPVRKTFGNTVPTRFFMGTPGKVSEARERFEIVRYEPSQTPEQWARVQDYEIHAFTQPEIKRYFVRMRQPGFTQGICLRPVQAGLAWFTGDEAACERGEGF